MTKSRHLGYRNNHALKVNLYATPELSYVLGVIHGDGWVVKYMHRKSGLFAYCVRLRVCHKIFADRFYEALSQLGFHPSLRIEDPKEANRQRVFKVEASSKPFYEKFTDDKNWVKEVAEEFSLDFIRGFYESEGSLQASDCLDKRNLNNIHMAHHIALSMYNTDRARMEFVQGLLSANGLDMNLHGPYYHKKQPNHSGLYVLSSSRQSLIKRFLGIINPCIKNGVISGSKQKIAFSYRDAEVN